MIVIYSIVILFDQSSWGKGVLGQILLFNVIISIILIVVKKIIVEL